MKVKLREYTRVFENDDTSFYIQSGEEKELPLKHLRSYSIKHALFHGILRVVEGEVLFKFKAGTIFINKDNFFPMPVLKVKTEGICNMLFLRHLQKASAISILRDS